MFIFSLIITIILFFITSAISILTIHKNEKIFIKYMEILFFISSISLIITGYLKFSFNSINDFVNATRSIWGYFFLIIIIMIMILMFLFFTNWNRQWQSIMPMAMPFLTVLLLISIAFVESQRTIPGEVENNLLPIHIVISTIGEILFFLSCAGSILYIFLQKQLKKKSSMKFIYKLPTLESIENFNKWTISRSFISLSVGLILGIILVYIEFGSSFLATPKEISIYSSWIVILILFYLRYKSNISSYKLSMINIVMFILILFIFIFTNIFIKSGFHSYQ